jgi:hypothetical protein
MQNTRLNRLVDASLTQFTLWASNPWRKTSLLLMTLLFGFFLGVAIPATAGQKAELDIIGAAILVLAIELVNRFVCRQRYDLSNSQLFLQCLNSLKIGMTYSLFLEAFKLAS